MGLTATINQSPKPISATSSNKAVQVMTQPVAVHKPDGYVKAAKHDTYGRVDEEEIDIGLDPLALGVAIFDSAYKEPKITSAYMHIFQKNQAYFFNDGPGFYYSDALRILSDNDQFTNGVLFEEYNNVKDSCIAMINLDHINRANKIRKYYANKFTMLKLHDPNISGFHAEVLSFCSRKNSHTIKLRELGLVISLHKMYVEDLFIDKNVLQTTPMDMSVNSTALMKLKLIDAVPTIMSKKHSYMIHFKDIDTNALVLLSLNNNFQDSFFLNYLYENNRVDVINATYHCKPIMFNDGKCYFKLVNYSLTLPFTEDIS